MLKPKDMVTQWLSSSGVTLGGGNVGDVPVRVHDERFYRRVVLQGSVGLGDSYVAGWWECEKLDELFCRILSAGIQKSMGWTWPVLAQMAKTLLFNFPKNRRNSSAAKHYDLDNDLFRAMLGPSMVYSCGYWQGRARTLEQAQCAKLELVCRKLGVRTRQNVLDIGCGWGAMCKYLAEHHGCRAVGLTVSCEQAGYALRSLIDLWDVEIRVGDYRDMNEVFDHILSIGMFEHVGPRNYRTYFEVARRCLKQDGLFLLHTITSPETNRPFDPWMGSRFSRMLTSPRSNRSPRQSRDCSSSRTFTTSGPIMTRPCAPGTTISSRTGRNCGKKTQENIRSSSAGSGGTIC
jgi:cyclopropane-fatty-acyl-phospholipid synthase